MHKTFITACGVAVLALFASSAQAQADKPGEDRAVSSKPSSASEKADAKAKRQAAGKEVVKKDEGRVDDAGVAGGKKATAEEKAAGKAKRQAEGKAAAKAGSGRLEDEGGKQ